MRFVLATLQIATIILGLAVLALFIFRPALAEPAPSLKGDAAALPSLPISQLVRRHAACARLANNIERLNCYNAIARDAGITTPEREARQERVLAEYGFWQVVIESEEQHEGRLYLMLESINRVRAEDGYDLTPTLTFMCEQSTTTLYLDWKRSITPDWQQTSAPLSFEIDAFRRVSQTWDLSQDKSALYSPDATKTIRALRGHKTMIVSVTPDGEATTTVAFDLTGFDNALQILVDRCYPNQINKEDVYAPDVTVHRHMDIPDYIAITHIPLGQIYDHTNSQPSFNVYRRR